MKNKRIVISVIIFTLTVLLSGCSNGSAASYDEGYEAGYNDGYEAGFSEAGENRNDDDSYDSGYSSTKEDIESLLEEAFGSGYSIGYGDGYSLNHYRKFDDEFLDKCFWDYVDGYFEGYTIRVSEIEDGKPFDYKVIPMIEVDSSFIDSVGYSDDNGILLIKMNGKDLYMYEDVGQFDFTDILGAESPGEYFNENIKGQYDYEKIY